MERPNPDRTEQQRQEDQQHLTQEDQQPIQRSQDQQEFERVRQMIDDGLQRIAQDEQGPQATSNDRIRRNLNNRRHQLQDQNQELERIRQQYRTEEDLLGRQNLRQQVVLIRQQVQIIHQRRVAGQRDAGGIPTSRNPGLTPGRIERFEHFRADESLVGERCLVCMKDLESGTQMVRLDCYVSHYLCKICADTWFKDHKTCPTCRHEFN